MKKLVSDMAEVDLAFIEGLPFVVAVLVGVEHSLDYTLVAYHLPT
jgi:hypothetical protein